MNAVVQTINSAGRAFVTSALPMLVQSSVLILILLLVDLVLRRKVRAVFRYWIWMLVLLKLVLPPSLWSPVSFGTWFGRTLEVPTVALEEPAEPPREELPVLPGWQPQAQLGDGLRPTRDNIIGGYAPTSGVAAASDSLPMETPDTGRAIVLEPDRLPAVPAMTPEPAPSLTWQGLALLVWATTAIALLLLLVQRALFVKDLVAQADPAPDSLQKALDACRGRMGLTGRLTLKISPNATSPAVCGLLSPVILIPRNLVPRLRPGDLQAVLLHELAHIKRSDLWINLLQTLLQIVYFYNPLFWIANVVIRRVREQAVDEAVLVALGDTARQYPETLLNIARLAFRRRPALSLRLVGVVESKSALRGRIKHILSRPVPKTAKLSLLGMAVVFLAAAILLPMAKARKNEGRPQFTEAQISAALESLRIDPNDRETLNVSYWWEGLDLDSNSKVPRRNGWPSGVDISFEAELRNGRRIEDFVAVSLGPGRIDAVYGRRILTLKSDDIGAAAAELLERFDELENSKAGMNGFYTNDLPTFFAVLSDGVVSAAAHLDRRGDSVAAEQKLSLIRMTKALARDVKIEYWQGVRPQDTTGADASAPLPLTERAEKVMPVAEQEARRLNHAYVGTEHILLALARQDAAVSAKALKNLGADIDTLRAEVNKFVQPGSEPVTQRTLPQTQRAKRVMKCARGEARTLGHDYIGTEHILLGLVREKESIAAQVLGSVGLTWHQIRAETLKFVKPGDTPPADPATSTSLADADGDGLSDFQEIHKYLTDPAKADSDGDGIGDGDWAERREYSYSVRTILRYLPPLDEDGLNDDFQDARVLNRTDGCIEVEVIHYPLATVYDSIGENPNWRQDYARMSEYLSPSVTSNWDRQMQRDLRAALKADSIDVERLTDKQVVQQVAQWLLHRSRSLDKVFTTYYAYYPEGKPQVYPGLEGAFRSEFERDSDNYDWTLDEHFDHELLGKGMFYNQTHGSCTSTAVYLNTVLRALGIPTRIILVTPAVDASDREQILMVKDAITHNRVRETMLAGLRRSSHGFTNHTFNEVYVGNRWVRLDYSTLGPPILGLRRSGLQTRLYTLNDLSDANFAPTWGKRYAEGQRNDMFKHSNPYSAVSISDSFGPHSRLPNPPFDPQDLASSSSPLSDIFIFSPSAINVWDEAMAIVKDRTFNKTGRPHRKEFYENIFEGVWAKKPGDVLVALFSLDTPERIPEGYGDLLPEPWPGIESRLRRGESVELGAEAREMNVILLAAPTAAELPALVEVSTLLKTLGTSTEATLEPAEAADRRSVPRPDAKVAGIGPAWEALRDRVGDRYRGTIGGFGRDETRCAEYFEKVLSWARAGDTFVLMFAFDEPTTVPPQYEDLLPVPMSEVSSRIGVGQWVEASRPARDLNVVLLAAPTLARLNEIVKTTPLLNANANFAAPAEAPETGTAGRQRIRLADLETPDANAVLDLATEQLLSARPMQYDEAYFRKLGKGDLVYESVGGKSGLLCLRGARLQRRTEAGTEPLTPDVTHESFVGYFIENVPAQYQVTTAEGDSYELNVISIDRGDGGGALVEFSRGATEQTEPVADVLANLRLLALGVVLFAHEHEGSLPSTLTAIEPYVPDREQLAWMRANVTYVGKGNVNRGAKPSAIPIAYMKAPEPMDGAYVAFMDGHAALVPAERFEELGLEPEDTARVNGPGPLGRYALSFDGVDDCLIVPASPSLRFKAPFFIEVWAKPDSSPSSAWLADDLSGRYLTSLIRQGAELRHPPVAEILDANDAEGIEVEKWPVVWSRTKIAFDGLQSGGFIGFTRERSGSLFVIREDGRPRQTNLFSTNQLLADRPGWRHFYTWLEDWEEYVPSDGPLVIGGNILPNGPAFKGQIAEVRIWNKMLPIYYTSSCGSTTVTGSEPNLVACWTFEEGNGQIVRDISPNGNHAWLGSSVEADATDPKWIDLAQTNEMSANGIPACVTEPPEQEAEAGAAAFASIQPRIDDADPQLRYLAWQVDDDAQPRRYWYPNGQRVTDSHELKTVQGAETKSIGRDGDPSSCQYLTLWFSNLAWHVPDDFDVRIVDRRTRGALPWKQSGWYKVVPANWTGVVFSIESEEAYPATCDVEIDCQDGAWQTVQGNIGCNPQGGVSLERNIRFSQTGENASNHTFALAIRDAQRTNERYRLVAVKNDGSLVEPGRPETTGPDEARQERFVFRVPLSEISHFTLQRQPITTVRLTDVQLPPWSGADASPTHELSDSGKLFGRILGLDGKPVTGAQVALCAADKGVVIRGSGLAPTNVPRYPSEIVQTDIDGRFSFAEAPEGFCIIAAHQTGFAKVASTAMALSADVQLKRWGRIEGTLRIGRELGADEKVALLNTVTRESDRGIQYDLGVETDSTGWFVFERVPPGQIRLGHQIPVGHGNSYANVRPIQVLSGRTVQVTLGGTGRPVVGRLVRPKDSNEPVDFAWGTYILTPAWPEEPRPADYNEMTEPQQTQWHKEWSETPESKTLWDAWRRNPNCRSYAFGVHEDGSFRIEDVIPGQYRLMVLLRELSPPRPSVKSIGPYFAIVEVPQMAEVYTSKPLDLGAVTLTLAEDSSAKASRASSADTSEADAADLKWSDLSETHGAQAVPEARECMLQLGLAVALYVNDHDGQLPTTLSALEPYLSEPEVFAWLNENVVYTGKGNVKDYPATYAVVTAHEKAPRPTGERYVTFLDGHVALVGADRFQTLGASGAAPSGPSSDLLKRLVEEARPGATVTVPKGTYGTPIEITKPLLLRGESEEGCIIEVTVDGPAIAIDTKGQGHVTIENLTVKWQRATSDSAERPFALAVKDSNVSVRHCRFVPLGNNQRCPMAVRIDGFSEATLSDCRFSGFDYTVCYGPGSEGIVQDCILTDPGHQGITGYENSTLRVERTIVIGSGYHGLRCTGGTLHARDNILADNRVSGVYLGNKDGRGTVIGNLMLRNGEGVAGFYQAEFSVEDNVIADSITAGLGAWSTCRLNVRRNVFQNNATALVVYPKGERDTNIIGRNTFWQNVADAKDCTLSADSILADPQFADPNHGDFSAAGPVREQNHGLTDSQTIRDLWPRYEQAQRQRPVDTATRRDVAPPGSQGPAPERPPGVRASLSTSLRANGLACRSAIATSATATMRAFASARATTIR